MASKVLDAIKVQVAQGGCDLHSSASIGISVLPCGGDGGKLMLKQADVASTTPRPWTKIVTSVTYANEMGMQAQERIEFKVRCDLH